ncbi:protein-tyrosine phosphatase family protein [Grimontia sp. NTOU-MAR1]|uniref:protein-tyrosine phosphatase family protein n=1 Tax=Grimontia sp. NTOU-MAR1 TaxID=3111011 RepID=UPI002DB93D5F|nr:hypothetical protein [Grimontia sp. NTOU-MAR1]WRW00996.1 hypothetical protein VP504_21370 [Grimontia sp. NTOU-MAR1]
MEKNNKRELPNELATYRYVNTGLEGGGSIYFMGFPGLTIAVDGSSFIHPLDMESTIVGLVEQGINYLVLLNEDHELPVNAKVDLKTCLTKYKIKLFELPVIDYGIPDSTGEYLWNIYLEELLLSLKSCKSVGFCCLSGTGRSAMFAARLLVEIGSCPRKAMEMVRRKLDGAIETIEQESWIEKVKGKRDD